jgi:hypothetical protein
MPSRPIWTMNSGAPYSRRTTDGRSENCSSAALPSPALDGWPATGGQAVDMACGEVDPAGQSDIQRGSRTDLNESAHRASGDIHRTGARPVQRLRLLVLAKAEHVAADLHPAQQAAAQHPAVATEHLLLLSTVACIQGPSRIRSPAVLGDPLATNSAQPRAPARSAPRRYMLASPIEGTVAWGRDARSG